MARRGAALLVVLALALLVSVHAGDYRNGHMRPRRDPATLEWNFKPTQVVERHKLPKVAWPPALIMSELAECRDGHPLPEHRGNQLVVMCDVQHFNWCDTKGLDLCTVRATVGQEVRICCSAVM